MKDVVRHTAGQTAAILFFALLLGSCSDSKNSNGGTEDAYPVEVAVASRQTVPRVLAFDADIEAEYEIQVFSKVPDRIEALFVDVGDRVVRGAPLARIRATTIEQAVRQAEAALASARSQEANGTLEYERAQRLFAEGAMSQQQLDAVKTHYDAAVAMREQAEATLKSARSQLHDAEITAPIAGVVATRNYDEGDMISPAQPLFSIVRMERVQVLFNVSETEIGRITTGQPARVRVRSYPDRLFEGTVKEISPVLDRLTRMGRVKAVLDNRSGLLKPGMFARVEVQVGSIVDVVVVPRYAVTGSTSLERRGEKAEAVTTYRVYVVQGERVVQRTLDVAYVNHEIVAVASGISEGERYVTVGQGALRDSARVKVQTPRESSQ